mgnify:CR=1 FL=1
MIIKRSLYHAFRGFFSFTRWMSRRFTPAGLLVVFGLCFSAFLGLDTRRSLAYQIFTLLASLVTLAVASGLLFRGRFQAERILPKFGTVGMPLNYRVVIRNTGAKPLSNLLLFEDFEDPRPDFQTFIRNQ